MEFESDFQGPILKSLPEFRNVVTIFGFLG